LNPQALHETEITKNPVSDSVSIIIPCYNAERVVGETIESALSQTDFDREIIVIDDGSTDGSRRVIESYGDRIRAGFGPNRGVSAARTHGESMAKGDFILYLDADDLLLPCSLADRVKLLRKSGADVVYGAWRRLEERDGAWAPTVEVRRRLEDVDADPEIAFFTEMWCPTAAYLWRRSFLRDRHPGWHSNLPVIQDARFAWDAARAGAKFVYDDNISVLYRTNQSNSVSTRSQAAFLRDRNFNAIEIERQWRADGPLTPARRRALLGVWGAITRSAYSVDRGLFDECWRRLQNLDSRHIPSGGKGFRALAGLVGYPNAEGLSHIIRRAMSMRGGKI
jgi:glycosyltransferase involved in cell wall biosynthesis